MTFDELKAAKDSVDKHDSDFYKLVGQTLGLRIIVDPSMPTDSWAIVCGKNFYDKVKKHCAEAKCQLSK